METFPKTGSKISRSFLATDQNTKEAVKISGSFSSFPLAYFKVYKIQSGCYEMLALSGHKYKTTFASLSQSIIWEIENEKLLGIIIDRKLILTDDVTSLCKKSGENYLI